MSDSLQEWRVAAPEQVNDPGALEFKVGDGSWPFRGFVVRWQGSLYAYENVCPHAGHPLNFRPDGFFNPDRTLLICSSHGAVFAPDSGDCVAGPCAGECLKRLSCREEEGGIYVRAPDTQQAG